MALLADMSSTTKEWHGAFGRHETKTIKSINIQKQTKYYVQILLTSDMLMQIKTSQTLNSMP